MNKEEIETRLLAKSNSIKSLIEQADRAGFDAAVIVGKDEESGRITSDVVVTGRNENDGATAGDQPVQTRPAPGGKKGRKADAKGAGDRDRVDGDDKADHGSAKDGGESQRQQMKDTRQQTESRS